MNELRDKLAKCNTLNEVFDELDDMYDLDQPLGPISKGILVRSVDRIIILTGAKKRQSQEEQP